MKRLFVLSLLSVVLLLSACNSGGLTNKLSDMDKWIDPAIQGHEREVMRQVLLGLEPEDRANVSYLAEDGKIYVNHPDLREDASVYKPISADSNIFSNTSGKFVAFPASTPRPDTAEVGTLGFSPGL